MFFFFSFDITICQIRRPNVTVGDYWYVSAGRLCVFYRTRNVGQIVRVKFSNWYSKRKNDRGSSNNSHVALSYAQLSVSVLYLIRIIRTYMYNIMLYFLLFFYSTTTICINCTDTFFKRNMTSVKIVDDEVQTAATIPSRYVHVVDPFASEITFNLGTCPSKKVLHVACNDAGKWIVNILYVESK